MCSAGWSRRLESLGTRCYRPLSIQLLTSASAKVIAIPAASAGIGALLDQSAIDNPTRDFPQRHDRRIGLLAPLGAIGDGAYGLAAVDDRALDHRLDVIGICSNPWRYRRRRHP